MSPAARESINLLKDYCRIMEAGQVNTPSGQGCYSRLQEANRLLSRPEIRTLLSRYTRFLDTLNASYFKRQLAPVLFRQHPPADFLS